MKQNPSQAASQGQGMRPQPSNTRRLPSSFILHTSSFVPQRSSFKLQRSSFILHTSYFRHLTFAFCVLTFAFAFCLLPTVLSAQGCAMCYNSASAAKAGAKEALANGVLILLVPPMVFFALITVVVYMYRNKFRETSTVPGPLSFVPSTWSVDQEPGFRITQEPGLRLTGQSTLLDEDDGQVTRDEGQRTSDNLFPLVR